MPNYNNANERGNWAAGTAYAANDEVEYEGTYYYAVQASTGVDPSGDSAGTYWAPIAKQTSAPDAPGFAKSVNEATYTAVNGDELGVTVATCTITLPASAPGNKVTVWSLAASATVTVNPPSGGATINGSTSATVTTQYSKKTFICFDGVNYVAA